MNTDKKLDLYPLNRIKPFDGMEVTAELWEQAHNYHTDSLQFHQRLFHGSGILTGLEVVAGDPADNLVYLMPGAAVDDLGRMIVLAEPVAYDFGEANTGLLYLTISYREKEKVIKGAGENDPKYTEQVFLVTGRPEPPSRTQIELARIVRSGKGKPIHNAEGLFKVKADELDLRFRRNIPMRDLQTMNSGVVYLGKNAGKVEGIGFNYLAASLARDSKWMLTVEDDIALDDDAVNFDLIYLVISGEVNLSADQQKSIKTYLEKQGCLFIESIDTAGKDSAQRLLANLKLGLKPVRRDHPLMQTPNLFAKAPNGGAKTGELQAKDAVVFSTYNYAQLWAGESEAGAPSREMIRSALEFGYNLVDYFGHHLA